MRPCQCRICQPESGDLAITPSRELIESVRANGWHSYHVTGSWHSWAYTMGFEHAFDRPEVVASGFAESDMGVMLGAIADYFAGGEYVEDETVARLGDDELGLQLVHPDWLATELFVGAQWFNRGIKRAAQVVLLSADPQWPKPPRLWLPPSEQSIEWRAFVAQGDVEWPHPVPWHTPVLVNQSIMRRGDWIFSVFHDDEDDWQCMDGFEFTVDDLELVPLSAILERDASVIQLLDLPQGEMAWREAPDAPWQRQPFEPLE